MVLKDQWNQIEIPEKDPHWIKCNGGKYNIFNKWCCFSQISLKKKVNLNSNHRPYNKTIPDEFRSNVRDKTIKLMEENIGEYLHDLKGEKIFLQELKWQS